MPRAILSWTCLLVFASFAHAQEEPVLPSPPLAPSVPIHSAPTAQSHTTNSAATANAVAATWLDTSNRANIAGLYNTVWAPSRTTATGWVGNVSGCLEGTTSQAWKDSVVTGLNFIRNLSGISGAIALDPNTSAQDQKAALMFSANNQISHSPPSNWNCYNAPGAQAAGSSNICLSSGFLSPGCLDLYMADFNSNNSAVGHRRWILYPQTQAFGTGDIPANGGRWSSNALWVFDGHYGTTRPATRESFVAWPSPGYFPYQLEPIRWSFSYGGASFASATVSVTSGGVLIPVSLEAVQDGYGENTIVFYQTGLNPSSVPNIAAPATDTVYDVTISNVVISGVPHNLTYQVIVFDPANPSGGLAPKLTMSKNHTGNFARGQASAQYSILVTNSGTAATDGSTVTVQDIIPSGLTLVSMTGPGWNCSSNTCTRNTVLNAGSTYPAITVVVNVAMNASSPQVNQANVAGGGSVSASGSDSTVISAAVGVATADSVTPSSGTGATQTFALQYSDTAGAANLQTAWVWFSAAFSSTSDSCFLYYDRTANKLNLAPDMTGPYLLATPGTVGTLQNSQCSVNMAATSAALNGNTLTLNLAMTFKPSFRGAKNIFMYGRDLSLTNSGWQTRGSWTVPAPAAVVTADSVTPGSGTGATQSFALQYSDSNGAASFQTTWVWFNAAFSSTSNSCFLYYDRAANQLNLAPDTTGSYLVATPGTAGTLQNSQCSVNLAATSVALNGNTLTLNLAMTFKPVFGGAKNIYMYGRDVSLTNSGWQTRGSWTVPAPAAVVTADSVTPGSGTGATQSFALQYSDSNGAASFQTAWVWFNAAFSSTANSCFLYYDRAANQLNLAPDTTGSYLVATPGTAGTLQNSQCSVNLAGTSVVLNGNTLTLNLAITFRPAFSGAKNIYMYGRDVSLTNSGWQTRGTWTVP
jgi:uncharacterized repeat protein (TIGR01451 family)